MLKALVVDDSRVMRVATGNVLRKLGIEPIEAQDGVSAIERFRESQPDIVLMDVCMPGIDGFDVVRQLRALCVAHWVPILFLSGLEQEQGVERAIAAGGDDFLTKPVSPVVLEAKIRALRRLDGMRRELVAVSDRLREANERLERISHQDGLTGIGNRRLFDLLLTRELGTARREGRPLSVLLADVDHFKAYNDTYGHQAGDDCLRQVATALASCCHRPSDVAARYGGEEFAIILPEAPSLGALKVANAVLKAVNALGIAHAGSSAASHVTLSLGVHTVVPDATTTVLGLLECADKALYRAKHAGRNQLALSNPAEIAPLRIAA